MTQQTDYHEWTIPTEGEDEGTWGGTLVELFDGEIDDELALSGTLANRPSSAPTGAFYRAVDREQLYRYDGSEWSVWKGFGAVAETGDPSTKASWSWGSLDWEDFGAAVEDGEPVGSAAAYGTVLHGPSVFSTPIDEWYIYWSTHDSNYIGLSTTPTPFAEWDTYGEVFSDADGTQTASPHAVYDPAAGHVKMYYHVNDDGQYTKWATLDDGGDGTSWTIQGDAITAPGGGAYDSRERSYFRAFRTGSGWVGTFNGRDERTNIKGTSVCHSQNGVDWNIEDTPAFDNAHLVAQADPDPKTNESGGAILARAGGEFHILYEHRANAEIRALPLAERHDPTLARGEVVYTMPAWLDAPSFSADALFNDGEYLYLLYHEQDPSDVRDMGIARTPLAGIGGRQ